MVDFIRNLCWHKSTSVFNSMINVFIFRCTDPETYNNYYYFADWPTPNNYPDYPYNKRWSCLCLREFKADSSKKAKVRKSIKNNLLKSFFFSSPQDNVSCLAGLLLVLEERWQIISLSLLSVEACFTEGVELKLYCQEVAFYIRFTRTTFEF